MWKDFPMSVPDRPAQWKTPDASTVIAVLSLVISVVTLVTRSAPRHFGVRRRGHRL